MNNFFKVLKCSILGHKYYLIKSLSDQSDLIGCRKCNKKFGINYSAGIILEWDRELEKFYKNLME